MNTFFIIKKLIENGCTENLLEKIDVFLLNNRISVSEYNELVPLLQIDEVE